MTKKNLVMLVAMTLVLVGCSSLKIAVVSPPAASLSGGKTVLIDTTLSDRVIPPLPIVDAAMYKEKVSKVIVDLAKIDAAKAEELSATAATAYGEAFSVDVVRVGNPFFTTSMPPDFYESIDAQGKAKLHEICTANDAQFVVGFISQIITSSVSGFGVKGASRSEAEFYVFDCSGAVVAPGTIRSATAISKPIPC